jgi:hypothetical protein
MEDFVYRNPLGWRRPEAGKIKERGLPWALFGLFVWQRTFKQNGRWTPLL